MISIIIPVFVLDGDLKDKTLKCFETLKKYSNDYELIVIDNGSPIPFDPLTFGYECDVYVRNKENKGNAGAWNEGLKLAKGEYLLLADNDVEFSEGWQQMQELADGAIVFPMTRFGNAGTDEYKQTLAGFFWMMSRATLEKIGPVSEEYGLAYYEDTDYFKRAMTQGIQLKCDTRVKIFHHGKSTSSKIPKMEDLENRNEKKYLSKWGYEYPYLTK